MKTCEKCKDEETEVSPVQTYRLPMYDGVDVTPTEHEICDSCALDLVEVLADFMDESE